MPDPAAPNPVPTRPPKGPNFLMVVVLTGVAFLIFFAGALLILRHDSRHLLPHQPRHTHAYLLQDFNPPSQARTALA